MMFQIFSNIKVLEMPIPKRYFIFEVRDFVFNLKANPCLHLISNNFDEVMIFLVFFLSRLDVPFASTGLVYSR